MPGARWSPRESLGWDPIKPSRPWKGFELNPRWWEAVEECQAGDYLFIISFSLFLQNQGHWRCLVCKLPQKYQPIFSFSTTDSLTLKVEFVNYTDVILWSGVKDISQCINFKCLDMRRKPKCTLAGKITMPFVNIFPVYNSLWGWDFTLNQTSVRNNERKTECRLQILLKIKGKCCSSINAEICALLFFLHPEIIVEWHLC